MKWFVLQKNSLLVSEESEKIRDFKYDIIGIIANRL